MIPDDARVLVVEDEPLIALQLEEAVLASGAAGTVVARTKDAPGLLDRAGYRFAAAIVAARAADEMGGALLDELDRRRVPFVMTTTDVVAAVPAGISVAHRVVAKPFSIDEVMAALRAVLRQGPPAG